MKNQNILGKIKSKSLKEAKEEMATQVQRPSPLMPGTHAVPQATCAHGCVSTEQWVCLQCAEVHCGRYVNKHAVAHHEACGHITAASLADLSVHCYACAAYVEHPRLTPLMQRLSALKFGEA